METTPETTAPTPSDGRAGAEAGSIPRLRLPSLGGDALENLLDTVGRGIRATRQFRGLQIMLCASMLAVGALLVSLPLLANGVDAESARYEIDVARSELGEATRRLALRTAEGAIDDTVFSHTDPVVDQDFFQKNMTSTREHDVESQIVYTFDSDDRVVFARDRAVPITGAREAAFERALRPLVARLRVSERGSDRLRRHPRPGHPAPVVAGATTIVVANRAYDVQALLMGSKAGQVAQRRARAPVLALVTDIEQCLLPPLRERFKLRDAAITLTPPAGGQSGVVMTDLDGRPVAYLAWTPRRQGRELMRHALPPILLVVLLLLGATLFAYRRGTRSAIALAESEARSYRLAFHDQLTDLANRRLLMQRLDAALKRARRGGGALALLLIDLDRFKAVNDTYGHQCGDELIREVARRLAAVTRDTDLCARLGGDEFVVLSSTIDPSEAAALAGRILEALNEPVRLAAATIHTAGSIGIGVSAAGDGDAADLLRQADLALYRVKERGRNNFCFFEIEMDQILQSRRVLERDLRADLAAGRITVAYQPQFTDGRLVAVEALARWEHPERGAIAPLAFIQLAEECGMIEELGFQVMRQVFEHSARWPGLKIAINLSPVQMRLPSFLPRLLAMVGELAVDPARFEFELTERILMADDLHTQQALASLRAIGFGLALDDFGVGYSSLGYLRRFPIGKIKIDRSFVAGLPDDRVSEAMIRAVVRLGRALGMAVVADGVETEAQRIRLATNGCRSIQGGLTGRPAPHAAIDAMLAGAWSRTPAA